MYSGLSRRLIVILTAILLVGSIASDVNAQKRRTKKSRRVTSPVTKSERAPTPSATSSDPSIISTAEESAYDSGTTSSTRRGSSKSGGAPLSTEDATREKVDKLTAQITALNEKLNQMQQQQRTLVDLERLSRAETRAEAMRVQLRDVQVKETELQSRAQQLEYELQPVVIERTLASSGSTRPEELREARRRQLETEKTNTQSLLNQLAASRTRLESAIANADSEADRLRTRIDSALTPSPDEPALTDVSAPVDPTTDPVVTSDGRP